MTLEQALIEHCSPTLVGLKPASLFRFQPADTREFVRTFLALRSQLEGAGLRLATLGARRRAGASPPSAPGERPQMVLLEGRADQAFLRSMGYAPWTGLRDCLRQLASRLCLQAEFPHEIGVFLGYPLDDVKGFIRHKGRNYTYCGCWKCYGDPQAARRRFGGFRRCTETFRRRYAAGTPIIQLVVAA